MATLSAGDFFIAGYRNAETQPARTTLVASTLVFHDDFGDCGDVDETNGIVAYASPKAEVGGDETIFIKGNSAFSFSVGGGASPSTAKVGFWKSADESIEAALELANWLLADSGEPAETSLTEACNVLESHGYWNSYTTTITPFRYS